MDKKLIKRLPNWDQDDKDLLSRLVLEKLEVIENARIDTNTNKKKKEAWNNVRDLFNKISKTERSIEQIQNQWRKAKSLTKLRNTAYLKQVKQTGGGPPPEALSTFDEELISRLPMHFEADSNIYDSNSPAIKPTSQLSNETDEFLNIDISDDIEDVEIKETPKKEVLNLKKKNVDENSKRNKLLDVSIQQKKMEIKYEKIEYENKISTYIRGKKKVLQLKKETLALQVIQMKEEHSLKIEKLKIVLQNAKTSGFFT